MQEFLRKENIKTIEPLLRDCAPLEPSPRSILPGRWCRPRDCVWSRTGRRRGSAGTTPASRGESARAYRCRRTWRATGESEIETSAKIESETALTVWNRLNSSRRVLFLARNSPPLLIQPVCTPVSSSSDVIMSWARVMSSLSMSLGRARHTRPAADSNHDSSVAGAALLAALATCCVPGRAGRQRVFLNEHRILHPQLRQVVERAAARHASTDDDDVRRGRCSLLQRLDVCSVRPARHRSSSSCRHVEQVRATYS